MEQSTVRRQYSLINTLKCFISCVSSIQLLVDWGNTSCPFNKGLKHIIYLQKSFSCSGPHIKSLYQRGRTFFLRLLATLGESFGLYVYKTVAYAHFLGATQLWIIWYSSDICKGIKMRKHKEATENETCFPLKVQVLQRCCLFPFSCKQNWPWWLHMALNEVPYSL